MIEKNDVIKNDVIFDDNLTHRMWWKRTWDENKPQACVIMLNPCSSDTIVADTTTTIVVNNIARFEEFGGVTIVNLFSYITTKLDFKDAHDVDFNDYSNDNFIKKAAEEASVVVLAWGKSADTNAKIYHRAEQVLKLLKGQKDKFRVIRAGDRLGIHPLTPQARKEWILEGIDEWLEQTKAAARKREQKERAQLATLNGAKAD